MAWGCPPSSIVLADTRMIHDFFDTLRSRFHPTTLAVSIPSVFDGMLYRAGDAQWEFWKSNLIQEVKIFYEHNIVTTADAEGLIIFNETIKNKYHDHADYPIGSKKREDLLIEKYVQSFVRQGKSEQEAE